VTQYFLWQDLKVLDEGLLAHCFCLCRQRNYNKMK